MENISVSVRVRPLNKQELSDGFAWKIEKNSLCQVDPRTRELERARDAKYALDHVFGPQQSTRELYETTTQGLIRKLVNGFNSTVFAYGQTSSGKTHTMRGTPDQPGIIPMAVQEVFTIIEAMQDREFLLRVSYMELYNEDINDLLAPENIKLPIHESKENGVYVAGLREDIVVSPEQVLELILQGEANRHIGATKMNEGSSRSHTVFRMVIESRAIDSAAEDPAANPDAGAILVSTLTLVDLAGSERVAKTGAEGIRMKEGTAINKSLLTLGNVINKLSDGAAVAGGHIPYRDSKLTRILQPSLGGNAKTAIICNMTPAACHVEESHSTLRFACRAKRVVNNAVVNEVLSDAAVLKRQANEIAELRKALATAGNADVEEQISHLRAQLLRSEQDNELMRIKLEQETAEREKAQKQVEMAKKIMFDKQQEQVKEEGGSRKNNRRETWCPGRSGWAPPLPEGGSRKRPLPSMALVEEDTISRSMMLSVLEEEEESDEPPTKVKRPSDVEMEDTSAEPGSSDSPVPELPPSVHVRKSSVTSGRGNSELVEMLQSRVRELESEAETTKQELANSAQQLQEQDEALRTAATQIQELTSTSAELSSSVEQLAVDKEKLVPQLEQARWQNRQLEKKLEDVAAAKEAAEQAATEAQEAAAAAVDAATSRDQQLQSRLDEVNAENSKLKEQFKDLNSSCLDLKGQLEVQTTQVSMLEAREKQHEQQAQEMAGKLKEKVVELETTGKQLQAAKEKLGEVEERSRELYDCNQRLEAHVHDLESRRRAPLYQKKQEEELKAAVDKAIEAETRAHEAELKAKELKESMNAAVKQLAELQEQLDAARQAAADEAAKIAAAHTVELQKLQVERAKLEATHQAALASLQAEVQRAKDAHQSLEEQLAARDATIAEHVQQLQQLQSAVVDLQNQLGESQSCATAAKDRIEVLEQEAEATATEHQQALEAATQALRAAQEAALLQLQEAQGAASAQAQQVAEVHAAEVAKVQAELNAVKTAAEGEVHQLQASLDSTSELLKKVMETATATEAAAAEAKAAAQKEVDAMKAKLAEAAGVLNAKEELREARVKHKQELAAIKQELTKLQQESKSGQKSKDVAAKELEGSKKKLQDVEAKLKVAISDKQAALQDKANLDRQLKQLNSKSTLLEKNLEKKDMQAEKRRESIMVGLSKTRDQLSSSEERIKQLQLENQRTQMDLLAKTGECSSLDKQLAEVQASEATLKQAKAALETKLAECEALLASTTATKDNLQGSVESLTEQLASLEASSADLEKSLKELQAAHSKVCLENQTLSDDLAQLHTGHKQLLLQKEVLDTQLGTLQPAHAELRQMYDKTISELQTTKAALQKAQEARVHAEGRLPEIEVLQKQISKAHEEMSDLRFKLEEQRAAAASKEQQLQAGKQHLESQLEAAVHQKERVQLEATAATTRATQHEKQLEELYELCTSQQGKLQSLMDEKKALELRADNLSGELQKSKSRLSEMDSKCQQLQAALEDLKVQHQQQALAADVSQQLAAKEEELQRLVASSTAEVQAWQLKVQELTEDHKRALQQVQSQLDQAYNDLSELQFSADHEKVQLEAQLQQTHEQLKVAEGKLAAGQASSSETAQQLHQELQQVQSAHAAAQTQMKQLQQELVSSQQELAAAQHDNAHMQSTIEKLTAQLQQEQQELAEMQQIVGVLQGLQQQQATLANQLQELRAAQKAAEEAVGLAQQQLHGAQTEYQAVQQVIAAAQSQQLAVQQQLENAQVLQPAVNAQLAVTQAAVREQQQLLQQVSSEIHAAEEAGLAVQQRLDELQEACRTAEGRKSELEAQIAALQDSCRDLNVQQQQLSELRALDKQTSDQLQPQQPVAVAEGTPSEPAGSVLAAGELETLRQQAAMAEQLQAEVHSLRLELQELEQLHHQNMEGAAAAGFTTSISRDPSTPTRSRDHLKWEITSLGDELKAAEQRRKAAEQQLVGKDKQLDELQEQIAELQQRLQDAVKSQGSGGSYAAVLKGGEMPVASDLQQICALEDQVQQLQQHVTDLQQQASQDAAEVERLSSLLASAEQLRNASGAGAHEVVVLQQEKLVAEQQAQQLQQQVEQLSAECQVLRQTAELHRIAAAAAEAANVAAQQQHQAAVQQLHELQLQVAQLSAECQALKQETSEHQAAVTAASAAASAELQQALAAAEQDIKQLQESLLAEQQSKETLQDQVSALKVAREELAASNDELQQQLAAARQAEAQVQQLQAKLLEAEQLKGLVEQLTAENTQVQQQLLQSQAAADSATQLKQELAHQAKQFQQLQQHNQQLQVQLATQSQNAQQELQEAENLRKILQQQHSEANKRNSAKAQQLNAAMEHLQHQLAAMQTKSSAEVEALVARDGHQIKQIGVLKAELARIRGSNRTESLAALHNEALQEVRSLAEAKQAELNARVLQLESHIHWLQQDNQRLQDECQKQAASAAASGDSGQQGSAAHLRERVAALESELRKSKRAAQKLQALLYRMRQDVEQLPTKPGMFDQLQEVRSLEYEVDFLTNKCKKYERILHQTAEQQQATNKTAASSKAGEGGAQVAAHGLADKENVQHGR